MTFFIYDPSKIFDPSTYIFYKAKSLGDLLNFSFVATAASLVYFKKKNPKKDISKIAIFLFSVIFLMGLFMGNTQNSNYHIDNGAESLEGLHLPQFKDYNEVMSID